MDNVKQTCTHRLLFCTETLCGVDNESANLVGIASVQGFNLHTVQHGCMEAGLFCEHLFKALWSPETIDNSMLQSYWTSVCNFEVLDRVIKFAGGSGVFK
jgi:hypothetical protein